MPENKLQHYVPRCHLRPFTKDSAGRSIDLFHIADKRIITNAPVKNQCAKDYFYGDDLALERALQGPEGRYAEIIRSIAVGEETQDDLTFLLQFFVIQNLRTFGFVEKMLAMADQTGRALGPSGPSEDQRLTWNDAVHMAMSNAMEVLSLGVVADLRVCIGVNGTGTPFITSDDPAVHVNRYYRQRLRHDGAGLYNTGAMLFLPLTDSHVLLAYDDNCYTTNDRQGHFIQIRRRQDVDCLNQLQMLNARQTLYMPDGTDHEHLSAGFAKVEAGRPNEWTRITYAVPDPSRPGTYVAVPTMPTEPGFLQHVEQVRPEPQSWPSFLPFKNKIRSNRTGTGAGDLRPAISLEDLEKRRVLRRAAS